MRSHPKRYQMRIGVWNGLLPFLGESADKIAAYLRPQGGRLIGLLCMQLLLSGVEILKPWPFRYVIDSVIGDRSIPLNITKPQLLALCVASVVFLYCISALFQVVFAYLNLKVGRRLVSSIRLELYDHLQRLPWSFHLNTQKGDLIYRITSDTGSLQQYLNSSLLPLLSSIVSIVGMFIILLRLDMPLALSSIGIIPVLVLLSAPFMRAINRYSHAMKTAQSDFLEQVQQGISNIQIVQIFSREPKELDQFKAKDQISQQTSVRFYMLQSIFGAVISIAIGIWVAIFMAIGTQQVLSGRITVGILTVYISYLAVILISINQSTGLISSMRSSAVGIQRVLHLLNQQSALQEGTRATVDASVFKGAIAFRNVYFAYNETSVLNGLSVVLPPGKRIAIVGPTGAGKTTLVNLILRFYDPHHGDVLIDNINIKDFTFDCLRKNITYVQQPPLIFPGTILDNILYSNPSATFEDIIMAAKRAHIHEFIESLPDGYETSVGQRSQAFSQGQLQRLSIARALLRDVPIIILDEPTSALDPATEAAVVAGIQALTAGKTTITIAHRLSTIRSSDLILVLDQGRVVESGTYQQLLAQGSLFKALHDQSFGILSDEKS